MSSNPPTSAPASGPTPAPASAPAPAPQAQPGQPGQQLIKAEDLARLRCLTDDQKQKYRPVLSNFWALTQSKPAGSPEHIQARNKLVEWSSKLIAQERSFRQKQQAQQTQQGIQGPQGPQGRQGPQPQQFQQTQATPQTMTKPAPPAMAAQTPQQMPAAPSQAQPPVQPPPQAINRGLGVPANPQQIPQQIPQQNLQQNVTFEIKQHLDKFPFRLPPGSAQVGPEADEKYKTMRNQYAAALIQQEKSTNRLRNIAGSIQQAQQAGHDVPQDLLNQKQIEDSTYAAAKKFVEDFRKTQQEWMAAGVPLYASQQPQAQASSQASQPQPPPPAVQQVQHQPQNPPQNIVKQEPTIKVEGGQPPQPPQPPQPFTNMQGGGVPQQLQQNVQPSQASTSQQPRAPPAPLQNPGSFGQAGQHPQQPHQPQRPQVNPQQANAQLQQQNNSPHPQSATSAGPGVPHPLTHHQAVSAASQSYSNSTAPRTNTPMPGQGNFQAPGSREREQLNNPKLPIPRNLSTAAPVPVSMGQARPTMGGPANGAPGPMGQPVINKFPPFQLEGEGDRVLSKRKLDELVRQVTGGSEDALTPEVEEAMLQLADEFVDTVITSACKLSKLRESSNLEIRDLQLVLERNYNIRIPGYASDEVRTVRKLIPTPAWTEKMKAVQAAKVMGGKTDI